MDLRNGSGVKEGKMRCIRCYGRGQMYKAMSGWCLDNSGGALTTCPMCMGEGVIDKLPFDEECASVDLKEKETNNGKAKRATRKPKVKEKEF